MYRQVALYLIFSFFSFNVGFGQSAVSTKLRADIIVNGFFDADPDADRASTRRNLVLPGPSFSIGAEFGYPLDTQKSIFLNTGLLSEFRNFSRFSSYKYDSGYESKRKKKFNSIYLSIPITIEKKLGRWSFNGGVIGSLNLRTRYAFEDCGAENGEKCILEEWYNITNYIGSSFDADNFMAEEVYADRWLDLQYSFGFRRQINQHMSLNFEYRDFILANHLNHSYFDYDVGVLDKLRQQTNSLHIGLIYELNTTD